MSLLNAVTNAIANPEQVRRSQQRACARSLSKLEPKLREVRDVFPESVPGVSGTATHYTTSSFSSRPRSEHSSRNLSRTSSRDQSPHPAPAIRPTSLLQRSHSDLPLKVPVLPTKREFTPCITAMDLTNDQIKRNYSSDDLLNWDKSRDPLPPLATMRGYGRYRTAESADPEWRLQYFKKQIKEIQHLEGMTASLDMEGMTGISNEEWQALTGCEPRRTGPVSSQSTTTDSITSLHESGVRIARGFSPSGSSTKSSQSGCVHVRKGSSLSTVNLTSDIESPVFAPPLKRSSTLLSERRPSGPLSTISELQPDAMMPIETKHKAERACEFTANGDPDSAVASDIEDDEDWTDIADTNRPKESGIAKALKDGKARDLHPQFGLARVRTMSSDKKRSKASTLALDRSRTIRAVKSEGRRGQSKSKSGHEREKSKEILDIEVVADDSADFRIRNPTRPEFRANSPAPSHTKHILPPTTNTEGPIEADAKLQSNGMSTQKWQRTRDRSTTAFFDANPVMIQTRRTVGPLALNGV